MSSQEDQQSRRSFLKNTSFGAAALGLSSLAALGAQVASNTKPEGLTILFQGDSITDGNRGRNEDPNHIMGHGYAFSIASRVGADFPEKKLKFYNRGISGNKVSDLAVRWQKDTLNLKPDLLSLLVGVNDANAAIKANDINVTASYEEVYRSLLDQVKQQNGNCLLVLCQPFILPVGRVKENLASWQSEIQKRQQAVSRLVKEYDAVHVTLQTVFDKACNKAPADYWIWDGIHPTVAGHELITREWLKKTSKRLPFLKRYV